MRAAIIATAFLLATLPTAVSAQAPVLVQVHAEHQGGDVVYRYAVMNDGPEEIRRVFIGCDCGGTPDMALPQLRTLPAGARPTRTDDFSIWFEVPPSAGMQPAGWRMRVLQPAGASGHWIEWYQPSARPGAGARAGQTLAGFSIRVPGGDGTYLSAHYAVRTRSGAALTAPLALADTLPPTLSVRLGAASAGSESATVRAQVGVRDDLDPEPRVVLESVERTGIGPAQESGYRVTYSATDASGNRAVTSASTRLPVADPKAGLRVVGLPRLVFLP